MLNRTYGKSYTLNFDGSHNNQANKSGAGCVIRDRQGDLFVAAAYNLNPAYCNVAIAEAVALRNGLELAKERGLTLNLIEGDNKEVIDHVLDRSRRPPSLHLSGIIQQIRGMINGAQKIEIIDREANQVADKLAFWGCNRIGEGRCQIFELSGDLPPQVAELIRLDKSRCSRVEEGSSMVNDLVRTGTAIAGVGMILWNAYKLMTDEGESSSDQQQHKNKAKAPQTSASSLRNYEYKSLQCNSDYYTLHYSGSDINQLKRGGAGCIIRNRQGDLVAAASYNLDHLDPDQFHIAIGEAMAWRNGLKLANDKKIKLDCIKGDNDEVINRVLGLEKAPGGPLLNKIIGEILEALRKQSINPHTQVIHIRKQANKVANRLAYLGSNNLRSGVVESYARVDQLPYEVAQLLQQDKMNWG